jgi:hypothetical protein
VFPPKENQNHVGCIHGIGHGLLSWENFEVVKALGDCDMLDLKYKSYCHEGVFMENTTSELQKAFDINDPWKFCRDLPQDYQHSCARYQAQVFIQEYSRDIELVSNSCAKAPYGSLKNICFEGVGHYVSQTAMGDPNKIYRECSYASVDDDRSTCIIGAARETIFQRYQDWEKISFNLCRGLKGNWINKCIDSINTTREIYKI